MGLVKHNWNADDYANNSSVQLQWADELIAKLDLKGSEYLLDIGCGDGKISAQLAHVVKNGHVLGIDSSESMINRASERFPPTTNPNLSFLQMDATEIHLSQRFDVAFSNAALHWVENHIAVLRGVHSCLKPGGKILFQMGGRGNAAEVFSAIREIIQRPQWKLYFEVFAAPYHFYGPEDYEDWLLESGFSSARVELILKDMQHNGAKGLMGWLRTTWFPYTDCLPVELRDAFLGELIEAYAATHPADAHGNTHVKMVRLEVEAYAL
ncbi:MAG: methyltransferase domain-containing protein [Proteobacteria bacterium]|nr:methyltransferase domain-containing protein [Pseudomonadota bacterium]